MQHFRTRTEPGTPWRKLLMSCEANLKNQRSLWDTSTHALGAMLGYKMIGLAKTC